MPLNLEDHLMIVAMAKAVLPLAKDRDPDLAIRIETALENDVAELRVTLERTSATVQKDYDEFLNRPAAFRQNTNSILDQTSAHLGVPLDHIGPSGA